MAEERRKKEEFREFQRKIKENIRDQFMQKGQSKEMEAEGDTQLMNGGGDEKDGEGGSGGQDGGLGQVEGKGDEEVASDKPQKGGNKGVAKK